MDELTIKCPVTVKVKVTEQYKMLNAVEIQETIKQLDSEMQQLEIQGNRMLADLAKQNPEGVALAKQHIEAQRQKRLDSKSQLLGKLKEIGKWADGTEVIHGSIETVRNLRVGDTWSELFATEVILCDDKVVEIRKSKKVST